MSTRTEHAPIVRAHSSVERDGARVRLLDPAGDAELVAICRTATEAETLQRALALVVAMQILDTPSHASSVYVTTLAGGRAAITAERSTRARMRRDRPGPDRVVVTGASLAEVVGLAAAELVQ